MKAYTSYPTEQEITQYYNEHRHLVNELADLYDHDFKATLKQQNKLYKDYRLQNKINYDDIRDQAHSLKAYTKAIYDQVTYESYSEYLSSFYEIMMTDIKQVLKQHKASLLDLCISFYIRNIYLPYKGTHQELTLQQTINESAYIQASYSPTLDKEYGVDFIISDNAVSLAIQLKSASNLYINNRLPQTEQKLKSYYKHTGIDYYYLFYDSEGKIIKKQIRGCNKYLFTYSEIQQIQNSNKANITSCDANNITNYLETVFLVSNMTSRKDNDNND